MDDDICPDCHGIDGTHEDDCHVGWAEHLKDVPSVVRKNPFLAMLKGHDEQQSGKEETTTS